MVLDIEPKRAHGELAVARSARPAPSTKADLESPRQPDGGDFLWRRSYWRRWNTKFHASLAVLVQSRAMKQIIVGVVEYIFDDLVSSGWGLMCAGQSVCRTFCMLNI